MSILGDKRLVPKKSPDLTTIWEVLFAGLDSGLDWTLDSGLDSGLDSKVL